MAKLAIFAGHGGTDPGAVAHGRKEKDMNLSLANAVSSILRNAGHTIIQNRTTDVNRSIDNDARKANDENVDYIIEFHFNAGGGEGTESIYSIVGGKSQQIATAITNRIASVGFKNRGVFTRTGSDGKDYFGIIRQTKAPAVIVEVCFIDSISDLNLYDSRPDIPNQIADTIHNFVSSPNPAPPHDEIIYVGECNTEALNVRSYAGVNNPILFKIVKGNSVNILDVRGDGWLKINCLHGTGYCNATYIDWPVQATGTCSADVLNVRHGAGTNFNVAYQIVKGNSVNILAQVGTWYYIETLHGRGYCSSAYIER